MIQNFYIFGVGRSGTTLFSSILNAHPNIVVPLESYFILHLQRNYEHVSTWTDDVISSFIDDLYTDRPFRLVWRVPRAEIVQAFKAYPELSSFHEACNIVRIAFQNSYKTKDIKWVGDKKPMYRHFTRRMMRLYPDAKIIHIVRDPRGVGLGHLKTFNFKDALAIGYMWAFSNARILTLKELYPHQYFFLKYEDLIRDTEGTMRKVCDFLEVPFEKEMLDYQKKVNARFDDYTEALKEKHLSLLKPIDINIAEKWKTDLSPKHRKFIEIATWEMAQRLGYHFEKPPSSLGIELQKPGAKFKVWLDRNGTRLFFAAPLFVRKFVLYLRSRHSDHKYWPDQPKNF